MNLRNASIDDIDRIFEIKKKSIKPYVEKLWGWDENFQRECHERDFDSSAIRLIDYQDQTVGCLTIKETAKEIFIENLWIVGEFQNLGIGKRVMREIIEMANSKEKRLLLQVFKINRRAQEFYKNLGFVKLSETTHHIVLIRTVLKQNKIA